MDPFYVMEIAKAASEIAKNFNESDSPMVYLNIGEPDFTAPVLVQKAAQSALTSGNTQYTPAIGLLPLRKRISTWYADRFNISVDASRIIITSGASAALHLACLALVDTGDEILMTDPCYPCNKQFVHSADGVATLLPSTAESRFQLTADQVNENWKPGQTKGILLASPSNPTGTSIEPEELKKIHQTVNILGGVTIVDEIYLGLSFDNKYGQTSLHLGENIISINSFSKYFNMTGWRLGWMVVPDYLVSTIERLAQNIFICPSALAQHAALACFEKESLHEYERRRQAFKDRRDYFIPALKNIGWKVPVIPDGGFYAWTDVTEICKYKGIKDSWDLSLQVMKEAHVAFTPGRDFSSNVGQNFVRFSTASSMEQLETAIDRLKKWSA